jgi:hypothetical protein
MEEEEQVISTELELNPVYWAKVQNPSLKSLSSELMLGTEGTYRTQKVLLVNEHPHAERHPEVVFYDRYFVGYVLMSVIAPLIATRYDGTERGLDDAFEDGEFLTELIDLIDQSYWTLIRNHISTLNCAADLGISLDSSSSTMLRGYKLALAREYRRDENDSTNS